MKFKNMVSYHCHTTFSDGINSVFEMVEHAQKIGFSEIGISDHLVLHPTLGEDVFWAMSLERLDAYVEMVEKAKVYFDIPLFLGLEVDYFPDNPRQKEFDEILNRYSFDYLVGSIHFIDTFPIDYLPSDWSVLSQDQINQKHRCYWENMKSLAETKMFDIIGHVDIIKKMNFPSTEDLTKLIDDALFAIASNNLALEINTAGWDKPCAELYPSLEILQKVHQLGIPIVMNDDAHSVEQLGQHYEKTLIYLDDQILLQSDLKSLLN
jgi:histidinol-phosphatase (PHP family)